MNKLKKIGLTALAGSLAAVSANAGELSVSGSYNLTYSTQTGDTGTATTDHGIGIGHDRDFQVSGSGELDNGWSVAGYTLTKDDLTVSSSNIALTMGSMGTVSVGHGTGGISTGYDVQTPTAYEEIDDGGATSLSANFVGSWADNNSLVYSAPAMSAGDFTINLGIEYSPEASGTSPADGAITSSTEYNNGYGVGVKATGMGLTVGVYGATREEDDASKVNMTAGSDTFEGVWYANYSMGPVSIGYSQSYYDLGENAADIAKTTPKTVGSAAGVFEAETYSIAFNVNDNFSVSYARADDTYDDQSNTKGGTEIEDVTQDYKSIQAAYSMGGMSIKAYRTETDNVNYDSNGGSLTVTEVALGLSF
jgi:outer membrane protein OmpU